MKSAGFTLIEMLAVVAVLGILATLTVPLTSKVLAAGRGTACRSNLRQIGLATQQHLLDSKRYPRAWTGSTNRWMDDLKPFLAKRCGVYLCPADTSKNPLPWDPEIRLSFGMNTFRFAGTESCFWYGVRASDVARPSETILYADCTPGKYYAGGGGTHRNPVPGAGDIAVAGKGSDLVGWRRSRPSEGPCFSWARTRWRGCSGPAWRCRQVFGAAVAMQWEDGRKVTAELAARSRPGRNGNPAGGRPGG